MDVKKQIKSYQGCVLHHQKQIAILQTLFSGTGNQPIFISSIPSANITVLYHLDASEEYFSELKTLFEKIANKHLERKVWCEQQIELLQQQSIGQG